MTTAGPTPALPPGPTRARRSRLPVRSVARRLAAGLTAALLCGLSAATWPVAAQNLSVAAVVNDDAISILDLENRMRLVVGTTRLPNNAATKQRLQGQVLQNLIDEKLQLQEARRLNATATDEEVQNAVRQIEAQNRIPPNTLLSRLRAAGIPEQTLLDRLRAQVAWIKVVRSRLAADLRITEPQVDAELARLRANAGKPEYLISTLFLAVDNPSQDTQVRAQADRLRREIRGGADFTAVAREFSDSSTAVTGGDLGWVPATQLEPAMESAVRGAGAGQIVGPVRTATGYHLIQVRGRRIAPKVPAAPATVSLAELFLPLPRNPSKDAVDEAERILREASGDLRDCRDVARMANQLRSPRPADLGTFAAGQEPQRLRQAISGLAEHQPSPIARSADGVSVFMVCDRTAATGEAAARTAVRERLTRERIDQLAQRYLQDLRRTSFIDIRIPR